MTRESASQCARCRSVRGGGWRGCDDDGNLQRGSVVKSAGGVFARKVQK